MWSIALLHVVNHENGRSNSHMHLKGWLERCSVVVVAAVVVVVVAVVVAVVMHMHARNYDSKAHARTTHTCTQTHSRVIAFCLAATHDTDTKNPPRRRTQSPHPVPPNNALVRGSDGRQVSAQSDAAHIAHMHMSDERCTTAATHGVSGGAGVGDKDGQTMLH